MSADLRARAARAIQRIADDPAAFGGSLSTALLRADTERVSSPSDPDGMDANVMVTQIAVAAIAAVLNGTARVAYDPLSANPRQVLLAAIQHLESTP